MAKDRNKYIVVGLGIAILIFAYYLLRDNLTEWNYNLDKTKKNAYGTFLTYELLKNKYEKDGFKLIDHSVVESFRKLKKDKSYNYIFLNRIPYYDSATVDTLSKFVAAGNTAFICCEQYNGSFEDSILWHTYHLRVLSNYSQLYYHLVEALDSSGISVPNTDSLANTKSGTFNFIDLQLKDKKGYQYFMLNKADTVSNYYLQFEATPDSEQIHNMPAENDITFTGYQQSYGIGLNFAVLKHGKGNFVLLLSALPFTNYFMRKEHGLEYAEKVLAYLPDRTTLWDDVSQDYNYTGNESHGSSEYGDSPLYYILKNGPLRWAWYLTILGVVIYAFFHAKRRQQIVPLLTPKQNTSLQYVETIGQLYYHEEEHIEIGNEMRLQFMNFVRKKYYLKTNEIDENFIRQLSLKSTINEERIRNLFVVFKDILKVRSIPGKKLQNLNEQLEYFYKTCK